MKTILKFTINAADGTIQMPPGAKVIFVGHQPERMSVAQIGLWAECEISEHGFNAGDDAEWRNFIIFGTGHPITKQHQLIYVGSAICGQYVWHVYEQVGDKE
jgi:hypothetical protein